MHQQSMYESKSTTCDFLLMLILTVAVGLLKVMRLEEETDLGICWNVIYMHSAGNGLQLEKPVWQIMRIADNVMCDKHFP